MAIHAEADLAELCLNIHNSDLPIVQALAKRLSALSISERHYWIGTLYTLMLDPHQRRTQAAYFTPPYLAEALIDFVASKGFDLGRDDVLDPAAGGAAFLSLIANRMRRIGLSEVDIAYRLNGIEIDPVLARMSESLIEERLEGFADRQIVHVGDALHAVPLASYDLVIANPPYGRLSISDVVGEHWSKVAHSGHINKYALFAELCFRVAKPNGLVALVIPSSFRSGPLYEKMRSFVLSQGQILALGSVSNRKDVFADVAQDVSVLVVRKGAAHQPSRHVEFPVFAPSGKSREEIRGTIAANPSIPWWAPSKFTNARGGATIEDYGAVAKAGHFVWNRERHKMCAEYESEARPLVWATNVRAGHPCIPATRDGTGVDFVKLGEGSTALVTNHAVVLQRTTNNNQARRLIAAVVDISAVARWGGFVCENHTIVLRGDGKRQMALLAVLLNTKAVDDRYRAASGTSNVSVHLLRQLDLPPPDIFRNALKETRDPERAAKLAYARAAAVAVPTLEEAG
ncbi:HsdM family class I SAM-dependent methyltransferase [Rhizobium leguminosarum]|uniref:HsdM family class I SAM-dependent methyltransferase n=1 Tax=Rhizobium leguminosarum TaxID=384 RepID=UPI0012F9D034|nr:N-6 DNA methylase [Rhizobium leguminosarum]